MQGIKRCDGSQGKTNNSADREVNDHVGETFSEKTKQKNAELEDDPKPFLTPAFSFRNLVYGLLFINTVQYGSMINLQRI